MRYFIVPFCVHFLQAWDFAYIVGFHDFLPDDLLFYRHIIPYDTLIFKSITARRSTFRIFNELRQTVLLHTAAWFGCAPYRGYISQFCTQPHRVQGRRLGRLTRPKRARPLRGRACSMRLRCISLHPPRKVRRAHHHTKSINNNLPPQSFLISAIAISPAVCYNYSAN